MSRTHRLEIVSINADYYLTCNVKTSHGQVRKGQISIPPAYMSRLNQKGQALLEKCQTAHQQGLCATMHDWCLVSAFGLDYDNVCLEGKLNDHLLATSPLIMIDPSPTPCWALTSSGSLYALSPSDAAKMNPLLAYKCD